MSEAVWTIDGRNVSEHPDHHAAEFRKTATVLAAPTIMGGVVETPEGTMAFAEGDYLVTDNPPTHLWPVKREVFERTYAAERAARAVDGLREALARLSVVYPEHNHPESSLCIPAFCPAGMKGFTVDALRAALAPRDTEEKP